MLPWPAPPLADDVIRLRPWRDDDQPAVVTAFADPRSSASRTGSQTTSPRRSSARLRGEQIQFALVDAADAVLGGASLYGFVEGRAGIGYWLVPAARGRGVATRAVRLLARWAFDALGVARLELTCGPDNVASQRVAERCGFTCEGLMRAHLPFKGGRRDTVLYSLLPDD